MEKKEPHVVANVITLIINIGAVIEARALEVPVLPVCAEGRDLTGIKASFGCGLTAGLELFVGLRGVRFVG